MQITIAQAGFFPNDNALVIGAILGTFALALIIVPMLSRFMCGK